MATITFETDGLVARIKTLGWPQEQIDLVLQVIIDLMAERIQAKQRPPENP